MVNMQLLLATGNLHKILELRAILKPLLKEVDLLSLRDFPSYLPPNETKTTFSENAELKALSAARAMNLLTIGDDSGLIIPSLGGRPGIFSSRYAGEDATDKQNTEKVLLEMKHVPIEGRGAFFECALSLASPTKIIKTTKGICEGFITLEQKGSRGFGYDSIFTKHDYNKTMAELDETTKNRISHRRKALDKLLITIESEILALTS